MPSFGMYTAEGSLGRWLVAAGSRVEAGDPIVEILTEKATYEVEAPASGVLHPTAVAGESLTVEGLIGWILADGETPPADGGDGAGPAPAATAGPVRRAPLPSGVKASPAARRLATEKGIDLAALTGTGPGGRIVEADVLALAQTAQPAPRELPWRVRQRIPLTGIRKTIAERLRWSFAEAVPLTLTREVRAEALMETRKGDVPYDALFVKILADSLRERPELNAVIGEGEILLLDETHVGFAVSLPGGLVVPVVRDADARPLSAIAADVAKLAASARAGTLGPQDLLGGTVTLSNLGASGVDAFTPVLNPPQSAVLGVGRIAARPVVEEGRLAAGHACVLSLTFDHRVADGAPAAELLAAIARRMGDREYLGGLG